MVLEPVLELALVDQAGLELLEIRLRSVGIKGVRHHRPSHFVTLKFSLEGAGWSRGRKARGRTTRAGRQAGVV